MSSSKLRRKIAWETARLIYQQQVSEYYAAKMKAARRIHKDWVKPRDLPSNAEIRDELQTLARTHEGPARQDPLLAMRLSALNMMHHLKLFQPRLVGSVLTGNIRQDSAIDLHLFCDNLASVSGALDQLDLSYRIERKRIRKADRQRTYTYLHVKADYPLELTVYPSELVKRHFKSSLTGKPMPRISLAELEQLLNREYPDLDLDDLLAEAAEQVDRFQVYEALLLPLEEVQQNRRYHPEGDALYHSLQVFQLACEELAFDEEFLLAALLHDVGKAIDRSDHVTAGLEALEGFITPRTAWLIEHHMTARTILDGTIGSRARRRLQANDSYEELVLLARCDQEGRVPGARAPELDESLNHLRKLTDQFN